MMLGQVDMGQVQRAAAADPLGSRGQAPHCTHGPMPAKTTWHLLWHGNNVHVTNEAEDQLKACKSQ